MNGGITLAPLIPWPLIAAAGVLAAVLLGIAAWRASRGVLWRVGAMAVLLAALANPMIVIEERSPRPDVAVVVVDQSGSQAVAGRADESAAALEQLRAAVSGFDNFELNVVRVDEGIPDSGDEGGTRLFGPLARAMAEVPSGQFAGAILITDGQVHDVPSRPPAGPLHVFLTGKRDEKDRHIVVERAPGYGIVGKKISVVFRVEDREGPANRMARVHFRVDGAEAGSALVPVGRNVTQEFVLDHAGVTVLELEAEPIEGELSTLNNRAVLAINGVRDRLRVLLVSGQPHAGERAWRNLLKSDPSVDLVHFTILRPPDKEDYTPLRELALISFPVRELFEVKLPDFDLIVFDRYRVRDVLPHAYLVNIGEYVRAGGALMLSVGPEFAGVRSLFQTPLGEIMPTVPTGRILERGFKPRLTQLGRRHPVSAGLEGGKGETWGRWFRQVEADVRDGQVLMEGIDGRPLLVLDRQGKGRVAQLLSDQIWLWARGFEGGGPQAELLRRLAHWLMKEPDLEEEALSARVHDGRLLIERRSLTAGPAEVTVTGPSGDKRTVTLEADDDEAPARARVDLEGPGLYRVDDGSRTALAAAGDLNSIEMTDLRATADRLAPIAGETGGGVAWIAAGIPEVRRTRSGRDTAGRGWIGLRRNQAFAITGVAETPLLPGPLALVLILGTLAAAWWREGR